VARTARDTSLAIGIGNFLLGSLFGHSIWPQGHARYIIQGPVHWDVSIARLLWPQNPEPPLTNHHPPVGAICKTSYTQRLSLPIEARNTLARQLLQHNLIIPKAN